MSLKNSADSFGAITKFFHWCIGPIIIVQYIVIYWKHYILPEKDPLGVFLVTEFHKPVGVIILCLVFLRFSWRLINTQPGYPPSVPVLEQKIAHAMHWFLYVCMFVMPISGIMMSTYGGYAINLWGFYQLPFFVAKNKELGSLWYNIHVYASYALLGAFCLHVLAAFYHHFILRNNILKRMLP